MDKLIIGEPLPAPRLVEWEAPTIDVAERWRDELVARGERADIDHKWSGIEAKIIVRYWEHHNRG